MADILSTSSLLIYVFIYIYICECVCIHIHVYTHTYINHRRAHFKLVKLKHGRYLVNILFAQVVLGALEVFCRPGAKRGLGLLWRHAPREGRVVGRVMRQLEYG